MDKKSRPTKIIVKKEEFTKFEPKKRASLFGVYLLSCWGHLNLLNRKTLIKNEIWALNPK